MKICCVLFNEYSVLPIPLCSLLFFLSTSSHGSLLFLLVFGPPHPSSCPEDIFYCSRQAGDPGESSSPREDGCPSSSTVSQRVDSPIQPSVSVQAVHRLDETHSHLLYSGSPADCKSHPRRHTQWKVNVKVAQSCFCDPMDYTVPGILQARILEWVAFLFSRGSSQPRGWTQVSHIAGGFFTSWATRENQEYWSG